MTGSTQRKFAFVTVAAIMLSAHATPASADFFGLGWRSASTAAQDCFDAVNKDAELQPIIERLSLLKTPSLSQLSDVSLPTDSDVALVQKLSDKRAPCRAKMLAATDEYHPALSSTYEVRFFEQDLVYVELLKRRITIGDATRRLQESYLAFSNRYNRYSEKMEARQRRQVVEQLQELADGFTSGKYSGTPPPNSPGGQTQYTCRWIGPTLYCDPY